MKIVKVNNLPQTYEADTIYIVRSSTSGLVEIYVTDNTGSEIRTLPDDSGVISSLLPRSEVGMTVASLVDGKIPTDQLPPAILGALTYQGTWNASTNNPAIPTASPSNKGWYYAVSTAGTSSIGGVTDWEIGDWVVSSGTGWGKIDNSDKVSSVAGKTGVVTLTKSDVGLGSVDNTSDANKPVSSATQTALGLKAPLADPTFTGIPKASTAVVGTSTTQLATTAFVNAEIANDAAPIAHVGATGVAHGVVTTTVAGFMSAADKTKLDGIAAGAQTNAVNSVAGKTGVVTLVKADVGLNNVDNTSDAAKPVSTAQATAISGAVADAATDATNKANAAQSAAIAASTPSSHAGSTGSAHGVATAAVHGFMSSTDKSKLDGIAAGATANTGTVTGVTATLPIVSSGGTAPIISINAATTSAAGSMSAVDKTKLDGITGTNTGDETTATIKSKLGITTLSGVNTGDQTTITGNAGTATKLQTARTINGVSFDGSTNITINAVDSTARIAASEKGVAGGVATLDAEGKVPATQLPSYVDDVIEVANYAALPAIGETGKIYVTVDNNKTYRWSGSTYVFITSGAVDSVAGKTGVVTLVKADVGLGNVDNTTDAAKPVSTAQAAAIATAKSEAATDATTKANAAQAAAITASAPAAHVGSSGTSHAVVTTSVAGFMSAADKTKLDGIAAGAQTNAVNSVAGKTGVVTLVKADVGLGSVDNTTDANKPVSTATQTALNLKANAANAALSGVPTAPTAVVGTNTTQLATTAFVNAEILADAAPIAHVGGGGTSHAVVVAGGAAGFMSGADKAKLDGVAAEATANSTDAQLKDRANHTGEQAISTVTGLDTALAGKAPLTGGGTSGTWPIDITGQSATVRTAASVKPSEDLPTTWPTGLSVRLTDNVGTYPAGSYSGLLTSKPWTVGYGTLQLNHAYNSNLNGIWYRQSIESSGNWTTWRKIVDSGDVNTYAPTLTGGGASGNWSINAATATKLATARTINGIAFDGSANISVPVDWSAVTGKPAVIATGADKAEARTAIGAGTGNSNLALGTTAGTAREGNWTPSMSDVGGLNAAIAALTNRAANEVVTGNWTFPGEKYLSGAASELNFTAPFNGMTIPNGYLKLVTPIKASDNQMFSIDIVGYDYSVGKSIDFTVVGYAYSGTSTIINIGFSNRSSFSRDVRLVLEARDGGERVMVLALGAETAAGVSNQAWYFQKLSVKVRLWSGLYATATVSDFSWVAGETTLSAGYFSSTNLNKLTMDGQLGTIVASGAITASNLSGVNTGDQTNITGNAATATKLATARTINGIAFDGSANISVPVDWSAVTGKPAVIAAGVDAATARSAIGAASLVGGKIPEHELPSLAITDVFPVASEAAMLALTAEKGDMAIRSDLNKCFALSAAPASTLANWLELKTPANAVLSVAGRTGAITLSSSDVGLGNANNTSDADKPVSAATQTALNGKEASIAVGTTAQYYRGDKTWQSLDKSAVGLSNVDNTSDASKAVLSATKLTTPRTINGVSFDGTANITVADATKLPLAGGTMTGAITFAGTQTWPTFNQSTTGNAATSTKLATARTINGVNFDGTANITVPVDWSAVTGKPAVIAAGTDAAAARAAIGAASLVNGKIPEDELPALAITDVFTVASQIAMLALTAERGDVAVRSDLNKSFALAAEPASTLANWVELRTPTDVVLSVAGKTGAVTLAKADVGLSNVDNTNDANKPVSTATQNALNGKLSLTGGTVTGELISSATNTFRMTQGNYGVFWRNDGVNTYLMVTASGDPNGSYTAARPLSMINATGVASINGNAATASAVAWTGVTGKPTVIAAGADDAAARAAIGALADAPSDGKTYGRKDAAWAEAVTLAGTQTLTNKTLTTPLITGTREVRVAMPANAIDLSAGNVFTKTISGATTLTVSNTPTTGNAASFILELTNAGSAAITWFSGVKWAGGTAPTLTAVGVDVLGFYSHDGGTTWRGMVLAKDSK